jgi:hypothetical protein
VSKEWGQADGMEGMGSKISLKFTQTDIIILIALPVFKGSGVTIAPFVSFSKTKTTLQ